MIKRAQSMRAPSETPLPEAIRARLDTIISEADRLLRIAQQRLDRAAKLQNKILLLQDRARTARTDLTEVSAERLRALIRVQQPPLWQMTFDEIDASSAGSTRFIGQALPSAWQFAQDNVTRVILHVGVFVAGFAFVSYLRRRFGSEPRGGRTSRAATRPISAATAADAAGGAGRLSGRAVERAADPGPAHDRADGAHPAAVPRSGAAAGGLCADRHAAARADHHARSRATSCCSASGCCC